MTRRADITPVAGLPPQHALLTVRAAHITRHPRFLTTPTP